VGSGGEREEGSTKQLFKVQHELTLRVSNMWGQVWKQEQGAFGMGVEEPDVSQEGKTSGNPIVKKPDTKRSRDRLRE